MLISVSRARNEQSPLAQRSIKILVLVLVLVVVVAAVVVACGCGCLLFEVAGLVAVA